MSFLFWTKYTTRKMCLFGHYYILFRSRLGLSMIVTTAAANARTNSCANLYAVHEMKTCKILMMKRVARSIAHVISQEKTANTNTAGIATATMTANRAFSDAMMLFRASILKCNYQHDQDKKSIFTLNT